MKITNRPTTDLIVMYINIPTDKGTEYYKVEIVRPNMDEDVYWINIYNLNGGQTLYNRFKINPKYVILDTDELDEREELLLTFIANRLELDEA